MSTKKIFNFDGDLKVRHSPVITEETISTQNVNHAETAGKLAESVEIKLSGKATGSATFDGSSNLEIEVTEIEKLNLEAGENISLDTDEETNTVTITNTYEHPTTETDETAADEEPEFGETVTVVTEITTDNGHTTSVTTASVKIPDTVATSETDGLMSKDDKVALDNHLATNHAPSDAEKNQNAFGTVTVGSTNINAASETDAIEFVAGTDIELAADATNKTITISSTYEHPTGDGYYHLPEGGEEEQILKWTKEGPSWADVENVEISNATTTTPGLMSAADKTKLDGIDNDIADAVYTHNTASDAHEDIRELIDELSEAVNTFLDVDDSTVDQLSEVLQLIEDNKDVIDEITTNKVNVTDIVDELTSTESGKVLSAKQGSVLKTLIDALENALEAHLSSHAPSDAEKNQNAFGTISVDGTDIDAESETDAFNIVAGDNIKLEVDESSKTLTISNEYSYEHPEIELSEETTDDDELEFGGEGTAVTGITVDENGHTTSVTTTTFKFPDTVADADTNGLMSKDAWTKLNDIEEGATNTVVDDSLDEESENPVQNKVIHAELANIRDYVDEEVATKTTVRIIIWEDEE
jgi:hypothetical protein